MSKLIWHGDEIYKKILKAAERGMNKTMSDAVITAKSSHPGWRNQTGTAEGSIRVVKFAERRGQGSIGSWGSPDVNYTWWLELKHGSFLRMSAARNYPNIADHVKKALKW